MKELISGFICCDLEEKEDLNTGKTVYGLKFNAGRLVGALLLAGIGATTKVLW